MLRRLFTLASAVSLLLCVATALVWGHGYAKGFTYRWADMQESPGGVTSWSDRTVASVDGRLTYMRQDQTAVEPPSNGHRESWRQSLRMYDREPLVLGKGYAPTIWPGRISADRFGVQVISFSARAQNPTLDEFGVSAPLWPVPVVLALPPAVWLYRRAVRRASARAGLCLACGYDLRATPDRCPECGAVPTVAK